MRSQIRILYIITELELGGAQKHLLKTVSELPRERFEAHLSAGSGGLLAEDARALLGNRFYEVRLLRRQIAPLCDLIALGRLVRMCLRLRPDIVHTHSSKAGILGRIAARLAGVPVVVHTVHGWGFHQYQSRWVRWVFVRLERLAARLSDRLIAVSRATAELGLKEGIGKRQQYETIACDIDLAGFSAGEEDRASVRQELGIEPDAPVVGSVACFKPQKDPVAFVNVAALVSAELPEARFVMVGDGELRTQVNIAIHKHGLADRIRMLGWRRDVSRLLAAMDVMLLTSLWEGLPLAIMEAMAAGVPVVATRVGGNEEAIEDGKSGFLVSPGDTGTATARVTQLLTDRSLADAMADAAKVKVKKMHQSVATLPRLYASLCDGII